jgi:CheY-like chemotaxis protein
LRVLVVDDDKVNLLVAQTLLEQMGHIVEMRRSGADGLDALGAQTFDVVLLDIAMPDEDGVSIARKIRARDGAARETPILAMTAKVSTESLVSYRAAGMSGVVPKPIIYEQLERALAEVSDIAMPEQLLRMCADVGAERYRLILRESSKVVAEARQEAETYRAGGSAGTLAAILHRLSPTAQMLGLSDLSTEAATIEDCLNRNAGTTDTLRLSGLLTQSMDRIEAWMSGQAAEATAE